MELKPLGLVYFISEDNLMSFHVPDKFRVMSGPMRSTAAAGNNGVFEIPPGRVGRRQLFFIASDGAGWEHVSVHARMADLMGTPTWDEMCYCKELCWDAEDVVMQLHPRLSEYVNNHPCTLHLWRPVGREIPAPPAILIGIPESDPRSRVFDRFKQCASRPQTSFE
jgi:hypothetical protein